MSAAVVIDLGYVVVLLGAAVVLFRLCRTRLTAAQRVVDDALRPVPAAADNLPGRDAEALDVCEPILGATNDRDAADETELQAGCARLWDALLDEKNNKGDS